MMKESSGLDDFSVCAKGYYEHMLAFSFAFARCLHSGLCHFEGMYIYLFLRRHSVCFGSLIVKVIPVLRLKGFVCRPKQTNTLTQEYTKFGT